MTLAMSVDLETLSTRIDCKIISIGACIFNTTGEPTFRPVAEFYAKVIMDDFQKLRRIDTSTLNWWFKQSPEAQAVFNPMNAISLKTALGELENFYKTYNCEQVWSKGANFDIAILDELYHEFAQTKHTPWSYKHVRCYRTLVELFPGNEPLFPGVQHNALADAKYQAEVCWNILQKIVQR